MNLPPSLPTLLARDALLRILILGVQLPPSNIYLDALTVPEATFLRLP
jgi:hypothetical protein